MKISLKGMYDFDAVLKRQPFVTGEVFSLADITVIGGLAGLVELRGSSSLLRKGARSVPA